VFVPRSGTNNLITQLEEMQGSSVSPRHEYKLGNYDRTAPTNGAVQLNSELHKLFLGNEMFKARLRIQIPPAEQASVIKYMN